LKLTGGPITKFLQTVGTEAKQKKVVRTKAKKWWKCKDQ